MPLVDAIRSHVFAAERIHADDTTVPVLAKGKTRTGRLWTYVRDDRPLPGQIRQRPCSSTRRIVAVSIRSSI
jgi:transposase